ncbi:MAG: hypothetical protein GXO11_04515 [Epsilonproteobacteria bacterium]|nr:hypothetical protein [Campylobacterota bacterium]
MGFPIFSKFFSFSSNQHSDKTISPIITLIEEYAKTKEYFFFRDMTIYHRSKSIKVPLMLFIQKIGIVLFSIKEWDYKDLENATLKRTSYLDDNENTLAFDNIQRFISEKLLDIAQIEDIHFVNFAILPRIAFKEYTLLDNSIKTLLPEEKILFEDTTLEDIDKKLSLLTSEKQYDPNKIIPFIYSEYMIIDQNNIALANEEQRAFIDTQLHSIKNISAKRISGKTHTLILKALKEKLYNPEKKITIIAPTKLHIYILRQLLLQLLEKSCIILDMAEFSFFTPEELIEFHAKKINKELMTYKKVDPILLKKEIFIAELILCDDANLFDREFITYLKKQQQKYSLCFINEQELTPTYIFTQTYLENKVEFHPNNSSSYLFTTLYNLLENDINASILIFTEIDEEKSLAEDIKNYTGITTNFIEQDNIQNIDKSQIQIAPLKSSIPLRAEYVFILTTDDTNLEDLTYLLNASKKTTFVLYNEENKTIKDFQKDLNGKSDKN